MFEKKNKKEEDRHGRSHLLPVCLLGRQRLERGLQVSHVLLELLHPQAGVLPPRGGLLLHQHVQPVAVLHDLLHPPVQLTDRDGLGKRTKKIRGRGFFSRPFVDLFSFPSHLHASPLALHEPGVGLLHRTVGGVVQLLHPPLEEVGSIICSGCGAPATLLPRGEKKNGLEVLEKAYPQR